MPGPRLQPLSESGSATHADRDRLTTQDLHSSDDKENETDLAAASTTTAPHIAPTNTAELHATATSNTLSSPSHSLPFGSSAGSPNRSTLNESNNNATSARTLASAALAKNELVLPDKYIKDDGCIEVVHELLGRPSLSNLHSIDLRGNAIRRRGADALAMLLSAERCEGLTSINLEWNFLGDEGGAGLDVICETLRSNRTVTLLDLRNNRLNSECGVSLARLLLSNSTLEVLDLRWNNLGAPGGAHLADALNRNQTIQRILLSGNRLPINTLKSIEESLARNRSNASKRSVAPILPLDPDPKLVAAQEELAGLKVRYAQSSATLARTQESLEVEQRRNEELVEELAKLRDQHSQQRSLSHAEVANLQRELEIVHKQRFEIDRQLAAAQASLQKATDENQRLQHELHVTQEERSKILSNRSESLANLHAQIESLQSSLRNAQKERHEAEATWREERNKMEAERATERIQLQREKEKEIAAAQERIRVLESDLSQSKESSASLLADLTSRLRSAQGSSGETNQTMLQLRAQLVQMKLAAEEVALKNESRLRSEYTANTEKVTKEFEAKIESLLKSKEELSRAHERSLKRNEELTTQLSQMKMDHVSALENERSRSTTNSSQVSKLQQEVFQKQATVIQLQHSIQTLTAHNDQLETQLEEQSRQAQEQVSTIQSQHVSDVQTLERRLRRERETRLRLEERLSAYEDEQKMRAQSLGAALDKLKSSVQIVDRSVRTGTTPSRRHRSSSSSRSRSRRQQEEDGHQSSHRMRHHHRHHHHRHHASAPRSLSQSFEQSESMLEQSQSMAGASMSMSQSRSTFPFSPPHQSYRGLSRAHEFSASQPVPQSRDNQPVSALSATAAPTVSSPTRDRAVVPQPQSHQPTSNTNIAPFDSSHVSLHSTTSPAHSQRSTPTLQQRQSQPLQPPSSSMAPSRDLDASSGSVGGGTASASASMNVGREVAAASSSSSPIAPTNGVPVLPIRPQQLQQQRWEASSGHVSADDPSDEAEESMGDVGGRNHERAASAATAVATASSSNVAGMSGSYTDSRISIEQESGMSIGASRSGATSRQGHRIQSMPMTAQQRQQYQQDDDDDDEVEEEVEISFEED